MRMWRTAVSVIGVLALAACGSGATGDPDEFEGWIEEQPGVSASTVTRPTDTSPISAQVTVDDADSARDFTRAFEEFAVDGPDYAAWSATVMWEVPVASDDGTPPTGTSAVTVSSVNRLVELPEDSAWEDPEAPLPTGFSSRTHGPSTVVYEVGSLADATAVPDTDLRVEVRETGDSHDFMTATNGQDARDRAEALLRIRDLGLETSVTDHKVTVDERPVAAVLAAGWDSGWTVSSPGTTIRAGSTVRENSVFLTDWAEHLVAVDDDTVALDVPWGRCESAVQAIMELQNVETVDLICTRASEPPAASVVEQSVRVSGSPAEVEDQLPRLIDLSRQDAKVALIMGTATPMLGLEAPVEDLPDLLESLRPLTSEGFWFVTVTGHGNASNYGVASFTTSRPAAVQEDLTFSRTFEDAQQQREFEEAIDTWH